MEIKHFIENHLPQMDSPEKVYQLFAGLGYKTLDPGFRGKEAWGLKEKDKESVKEIYALANYEKRFQILLVELKYLSPSILKTLPLDLEREIPYPLFVFTPDYQNYTFVLVEKIREDVGVWKRKIVRLNFDRSSAYYTDKMVISNMAVIEGIDDPLYFYKTLREALSVEKVSKIFFKDYRAIFFEIREFLLKQKINVKQAHEFSQQLLNRTMFIYFIDKKRWLKNSPKFMKWFWDRYLKEKKKLDGQDHFYEKWLLILFLEAFNNRFSHPHYFPQDVRDTLALAPYLNGGLFKRNDLDDLPVNLPDLFVEKVLQFFEKYNFTIREDLPLDVEVAVDPQMIGYVYESLANVAEEIYERQDLGIFYTPKVEVDFMCRRSLSEYLSKTTDISKELLYRLLFDEDKTKIEKLLSLSDYEKLEDALDNLSVLDPACGSGAFLVGMLNVLIELYKLIFRHLNREMADYQLKKRIIGKSLYGVDVMPWAVHSAELRLWLSLMIESDLSLGELKLYPLLPNLDLKLRVGDSLVQEVGGVNLNLRDIALSSSLKRKLSELKSEKEKYYNNDPTAKFKTDRALLQEELRIFYGILDERIVNLEKKKQELTGKRKADQLEMFEKGFDQKKLFDEKEMQEAIEARKKKIDEEIDELLNIKRKLKEQKPFVWDIDFAEIFGEKEGFDIVIGNPPYVRQEKIAPPNKLRSEITNEEKREYKIKLLKSVQAQFPLIKSIDKKSDYYIYFYFHGLSLLNKEGTFCFITSNSWLDVGYGKDLQKFLLEHVPIIAIYDNQAKRSFEHADVNTIIALFGAPVRARCTVPLQNMAKFVMFKKLFEEVVNTENLLKIENADAVTTTDGFRVYPKKQEQLLEEGWEFSEEENLESGETNVIARSRATKQSQKPLFKGKFETGKYIGNKWGGKYLRAPDIFFTILEKGKGKLVKLGDIAEVRFGIKTGANEFFYLDEEKIGEWGIEKEFLKPVIKSPRECESILIKPEDLKFKVFMCHKDKKDLKGTNALKYIEWGEESRRDSEGKEIGQFHKRPSCRGRQRWWECSDEKGNLFWGKEIRERIAVFVSNDTMYADCRLYFARADDLVGAALNSTLTAFISEVSARNLGGGGGPRSMMVYEVQSLLTINPEILVIEKSKLSDRFHALASRDIQSIFTELVINPSRPIREQNPNPLPDRKALDDIVFDILGLTQQERNEVYWAVCELVKNRLEKAKSV